MKYKIGVFGSAEGEFDKILTKVSQLAKHLGKQNIILLTGASSGLPYLVASQAKNQGIKVWGFSKGTDFKEQKLFNPTIDSSVFDKLIYIPKTYKFATSDKVCMKYRNVTSTATCDAGIIISGRWGTLNEFTNLYDMGKIIGVLTGTGGIADELESLMRKVKKKSDAKVVFDSSPAKLVDKIITELSTRN